jgi:hypothetical protein
MYTKAALSKNNLKLISRIWFEAVSLAKKFADPQIYNPNCDEQNRSLLSIEHQSSQRLSKKLANPSKMGIAN